MPAPIPTPTAGTGAVLSPTTPNPVQFNFAPGTVVSSSQSNSNNYGGWSEFFTLIGLLNGCNWIPSGAVAAVSVGTGLSGSVASCVANSGAGVALTLNLAHGDYVDLANDQTVAGVKTFTSATHVNNAFSVNGGYAPGVGYVGLSTGVGSAIVYLGAASSTANLGLISWTCCTTGYAFSNAGAGATVANLDPGGTWHAVAYQTTSVRAVKKHITPIASALADADRVRAVRYCYIREACKPGETFHVGLIADDSPDDVAPHHQKLDVGAAAVVALAAVGELHRALQLLAGGTALAIVLATLLAYRPARWS